MDIATLRDWIIVIQGILQIVFILVFFIVVLILYLKINRLIGQGKQTVRRIERAFATPYYKAGSWLFKCLAAGFGIFSKEKNEKGGC